MQTRRLNSPHIGRKKIHDLTKKYAVSANVICTLKWEGYSKNWLNQQKCTLKGIKKTENCSFNTLFVLVLYAKNR